MHAKIFKLQRFSKKFMKKICIKTPQLHLPLKQNSNFQLSAIEPSNHHSVCCKEQNTERLEHDLHDFYFIFSTCSFFYRQRIYANCTFRETLQMREKKARMLIERE